jgi:isopenicillin N synthase-like dioxygenase
MKDKKDNLKAVNQDFSKYDQVEKKQVYNLSEIEGEDEFDENYIIKTVDMSGFLTGNLQEIEKFSQDLGEAMEKIGFVILTGHGIDINIFSEARKKIIEFFEDIPEVERIPYKAKRQGSVNQGYFPINETTIIHPDLVKGWVFCRRAFNMNNDPDYNEKDYWPRPGYEPFFRELCKAKETIILPIMQSILRYLKCDPHSFDKKLTDTNFGFRLNYYPALDDEYRSKGAGRMLGHEDVDLFTILPSEDLDGLQALNRENMKWVRIHAPKGSIVINTGDYMQRITNDRLPSTTHRVSTPKQESKYSKTRVSFPMAVYVWEDEILTVLPELENPKYPPISAIEFHTKITSKYYGDDYAVDLND